MPLCLTDTWCKEVVVPDKNGNPIGGLTCVDLCKGVGAPPGYKKWTSKSAGSLSSGTDDVLTLVDDETGVVLELTRAECRVILRAYRQRWGAP